MQTLPKCTQRLRMALARGAGGGGTVPWFWLLKLAGPCWSWEAPDWGCWRQSLGGRRALVFLPFAPVSRVLAPAESMVGAEGTQRTHVFQGQSRFVQRGHSPGSLGHLRPMEPEAVWKPRAGRIVRSSYSGVSLMTLGPRACEAKAIDFWTARGSLTCGHQVAADSWPGWVRPPSLTKVHGGPGGLRLPAWAGPSRSQLWGGGAGVCSKDHSAVSLTGSFP